MKKRYFGLLSLFLLASCGSPSESAPASSFREINGTIDKALAFLSLTSHANKVARGDTNCYKISSLEDKPLIDFSFETDGDISLGFEEDSKEMSKYALEIFSDDVRIDSYNRTKNVGYKNRIQFNDSVLKIAKNKKETISMNQTYTAYLAENELTGTDPKEYEHGLYLDLSKAQMSKLLLSSYLEKDELNSNLYINADQLYTSMNEFFPLATTSSKYFPVAVETLAAGVESGIFTLNKMYSDSSYLLYAGFKSKYEIYNFLMDIVDTYLIENGYDSIMDIVHMAADKVFEEIEDINGFLSINFDKNEIISLDFSFNLELVGYTPSSKIFENTKFILDGLSLSGRMSILDKSSIDYSYPGNLLDHNVWEELV